MAELRPHPEPNREALDQAIADLITDIARQEAPQPHAIMLSGGSTPLPAYRSVAASGVKAASGLHILFTDDRHVPPSSADSNLGNSRPMIDSLGVSPEHVLQIRSELPLEEAATDYDNQLEHYLAAGGTIEVGLLGLGTDGHTCSIFDREAAIRTNCLAFAVPATSGFDRVSVSRAVLLRTKRIILMVAGESKADVVQTLLSDPMSLPAGAALAGHPRVELWTDLPV